MGSAVLAPSTFVVVSFLLSLFSLGSLQAFTTTCPFNCSSLGQIDFPFSNTSNPNCGLCTMDCTDNKPKIQFKKKGKWYNVEQMDHDNRTIEIYDPEFENTLVSSYCHLLDNFTAKESPLSFEVISRRFYFVKCKREGTPTSLSESFPWSQNFKDCKDYDIFFNWFTSEIIPIIPNYLSNRCSVVQLPVKKELENWFKPLEKLEDLLTAKFSLLWYIPPDCYHCNWKQGGQCVGDDKGKFRCEDANDGKEMKQGGYNLGLKIGIGTGLASIFVTGMVIILCCLRRKYSSNDSMIFWKKKSENDKNVEEFLKKHGDLVVKRYNYSDVKKITFSFKEKLGQGGYGGVFKGELLDGRVVAVKVLSETKGNGEEFINEVASISRTSHVNIVTLIGFCVEGPKRALIYEFMTNGSLEKFIYDEKPAKTHPHLGWETLYKIVVGIARGLEYLHHGCNTRILHFDIKPHNILLDQDFCPKISDFGLAKLCLVKESIISMTGARGTAGYIAPELFSRNFGGVSHKSDVYSYGMMVLEMVGGRKNFDGGVANSSEIYFPHWIYKHLNQCGDLSLPGVATMEENEITRKMVLVGLWCIQIDPLNRPSMSRVLEMLEGNLESLQIPPKPFLSSPSREHEGSSTI